MTEKCNISLRSSEAAGTMQKNTLGCKGLPLIWFLHLIEKQASGRQNIAGKMHLRVVAGTKSVRAQTMQIMNDLSELAKFYLFFPEII